MNAPINDGGPAFPIGTGDMRDPTGMTLRDYFAAAALQGLLTQSRVVSAKEAYRLADAMLAARTKGGAG